MANPNKKQGTSLESQTAAVFNAAGIPTRRLAEGGSKDIGDLEVSFGAEVIILEVKSRERLEVHSTLRKAILKAAGSRRRVHHTALVWKRLQRSKADAARRTSKGTVVVLTLEKYLQLLRDAAGHRAGLGEDGSDVVG